MLEPGSPPPPVDDQTAQLKRIGDELRELRWQMGETHKRRVTASMIGIWIGWVMICLTIAILWLVGGLALVISAIAAVKH